MGRKHAITPEILDNIVKFHREGATIKEASAMAGANPNSIYTYMGQGKVAKSGKKRDFYLKMEEAKASFCNEIKDRMVDTGSPKALEFILRVTDPETYNISSKQEVKADVKKDVRLNSVFSKQTIENFIEDSVDSDDIEDDLNELDKNANK